MIDGFPSVPNLTPLVKAGVTSAINLGVSSAIRAVFSDQWGVFSEFGVPILLADTVDSVDFRNSSEISSAPVEKGSFASYNKVQNPYEATVRMTRGGSSPTLRGAFLAQIEAVSKTDLLYHIITPDYVHRNANITGFSYQRTPKQGARIVTAEIYLKEVRMVTVGYSDTDQVSSLSDATGIDLGQVSLEGIGSSILSGAADAIEGVVGNLGSWGDFLGN